MLIKNGVIQVNQLRRSVLSHEQLYEQLRRRKIYQLGQVKRVYVEGSGQFSVFKYAQEKPGLCLFPDDDEPLYKGTPRSKELLTCKNCGTLTRNQEPSTKPCPFCGMNDWDKAVAVDKEESVNAANIYTHMHRMISFRKQFPQIGTGNWQLLKMNSSQAMAIRYEGEKNRLVVIHNFSPEPQQINLALKDIKSDSLHNVFTGQDKKVQADGTFLINLEGYGYSWYRK